MFREVTDRIRDAEVDVVLNLTAGMGGDMVFGDVEKPVAAQCGHGYGRCQRTGGPCSTMSARDLYAGLWHHEFC